MTELMRFEGREIRMATVDSEPMWVAKDVCDVLGLIDSRVATRSVPEEDKGGCDILTPGGSQQMTVVNEAGLYRLIFKSTKPEAERFKNWVTREVLPALRRTGRYEVPQSRLGQVKQAASDAQDIFDTMRIPLEGNQRLLAINRLVSKVNGGFDVLGIADATLETDEVTLTPTQIGSELGLSAVKTNQKLAECGLQERVGKSWVPTDSGKRWAVVIDTGKRHKTDGAPVTQVKWKSTVMQQIASDE